MPITIAALYQFARIPDPNSLRAALLPMALAGGIKGTLILAGEGINGTIAGETAAIMDFLAALRAGVADAPPLDAMELKLARAERIPFRRLKIRIKPEIVTLGVKGLDPTARVGIYVPPSEWNALITQPDMLLLDTRNSFEVAYGTFTGAVDPLTERFSAFPDFVDTQLDPAVHRRVAMFCTGGIRCEKASALLLARGFAEVYHLQGGILAYLEQVQPENSLWQGECFVFDERESVGPK